MKLLREKSYEIVFVDYTEEIVEEVESILSNVNFIIVGMGDLNLKEKE